MSLNIETDLKEILNKLETKLDKVSNDVSEIKTDVVDIKTKVSDIDQRLLIVETRIDEQKAAIGKIPDLAEKVGELKNWRQIAIIIITGTASTVFGWLLRSGKW
jgi:predicted  nucleic acid-binding Zn-ribbon protein